MSTPKGKLIIFSAPSGSGKSTLVQYLLTQVPGFAFSISATSRAPRGAEKDGVDYYFLSLEEFQQRVAEDAFLEWEEVYPGQCYGTLKSEVEKSWEDGDAVAFDIDVVGGKNLKAQFGEQALALFIQAPSVEELERRLVARGTDSPEKIKLRIEKASWEMNQSEYFDHIIINDDLDRAKAEAKKLLVDFLAK
ncbi:guanylate kinase [Schleiferiaceae bacterium]|nr:guanylate kinase [Schleiferiaceae bacterium]MDB2435391.1 guanylate kinase [Schleiferiaceae bacterium]MDB2539456.1 guanylate kinase [Schleiferiaceae bacterium]MDB2539475.1 guanylate kinase [Schleiferiaceae bacterium]